MKYAIQNKCEFDLFIFDIADVFGEWWRDIVHIGGVCCLVLGRVLWC
jgi:hypothetical protein